MFRVGQLRLTFLFDEPGDPGGGGAPAAAPEPSPAGPPSAPTAAPSPSGTPPPPAGSGTPAPSSPGSQQYTYEEDRSKWLSPEKVNQILQGRLHPIISERDRYEAMLKAGGYMGDKPVELTREEKEAQEVLYRLTGLTADDVKFLRENRDKLDGLVKLGPELQNSHETPWSAHGARVLHELDTAAAKALGVEKLEPFQQRALGSTFAAWLQDPQLQQRYTWGDPNLVTEFIHQWQRGFIDPARRLGAAPAAATAAGNRGLPAAPQPGGSAPAGTQGGAAQPKTEDETFEAAWQAMKANRAAASV